MREPGELVDGNYRILRTLGRGGMGVVYEAHDVAHGRSVALKVLDPELSFDEIQIERFWREAHSASAVSSDHVARMYATGRDPEGDRYIAMEFVPGEGLDVWLARGRVELAVAVEVIRQMLDALGTIHARGLVHRDLKPQNVLVERRVDRLHVKIVDFGIAVFVVDDAADLTPVGITMSTPQYASPEQLFGHDGRDPSVDLWAVGVMFYQLVAGKSPHEAPTLAEFFQRVMREPPPPIDGVSEAVSEFVSRALATDPRRRFASAAQMREALAAL